MPCPRAQHARARTHAHCARAGALGEVGCPSRTHARTHARTYVRSTHMCPHARTQHPLRRARVHCFARQVPLAKEIMDKNQKGMPIHRVPIVEY